MACDRRSAIRGATGKLKAAVRHWLGGGDVADETDTALAAFGLTQDVGVYGNTPELDEPFKVYAINWETLQVFWATWNQWRKVVIGNQAVRDCIDWAQVESALKLSKVKRGKWPMIFEGLRAMQDEVLEYLNEGSA